MVSLSYRTVRDLSSQQGGRQVDSYFMIAGNCAHMAAPDLYAEWPLSDRLQMLAFEAELAHLHPSLIATIWEVIDRFPNMPWKPSEEHEKEVRRWMTSKGWEVTRTNCDFKRGIYSWRHELPEGNSPTLRISRQVLEDYPAFMVLHHLDELKVAQAIRARPEARLVMVQKGLTVTLDESP